MVGFNPEPINGRELSSFEYSEAGLLSGIATRAIIQPLDVLKIRFQLQEEPMKGQKTGKYTGLFQSIKVISKEEGIRAFWKGHIPAQGLSAVYGLVQFTSFEILTRQLVSLDVYFKNNPKTTDFIAGALAGCTAMTAAMPLDVIRTRLVAQGEPKVYRSTIHAVIKIWRYEKVPGFFRGITPSLAQIAPFTGLQFLLYNYIHKIWMQYTKHDTAGALVSGATAGTLSKMILYPLDLVRHRLQVNAFVRRGFGSTTRHKSMITAIIGIIKKESLFGLFKGLGPSLIKAGANSGCSFLFYEIACDVLRKL